MGVGMTLKTILRDKKMTIRQLAENSGISVNTLYSITRRDSERVDDVILQRIADALGIHIFDLTGIGKELDKYVPKLEDISFPPDISPFEKARTLGLFMKNDWRDLYNMLSDEDKEEFWKIGRDYKADVDQIAKDYDNLDQWGKKTVRAVISAEQERMHGTEDTNTTPPPPPPESPENGG